MEPQATSSSSKLIISIIVILVIAGIAVALVRSKDEGLAGDDNATTTPSEASFVGSIWDLIRGGDDRKCTWKNDVDGVTLEGVIYASRGKFKSDIETSAGDITLVAHTLSDGAYIYSWTSASQQGTKFPMGDVVAEDAVPATTKEMEPFVEEFNFDCDAWTADSGTFALPSGITFTEVATQ
ncbi:MAG: hypothetical protein AAB460_02765 [Patescibacteria group bacterium]